MYSLIIFCDGKRDCLRLYKRRLVLLVSVFCVLCWEDVSGMYVVCLLLDGGGGYIVGCFCEGF